MPTWIRYPAHVYFAVEGEREKIQNKHKLKESTITKTITIARKEKGDRRVRADGRYESTEPYKTHKWQELIYNLQS